MNYIEVTLVPEPMSEAVSDLIPALLADLGYDSFSADDVSVKAYCPVSQFDAEALNDCLSQFPLPDVSIRWSSFEVETQNWNEQWEQEHTLTPIPFGQETITIHPCMSFGSGHHETTSQLLQAILELDLAGKQVLDMGTGTGVLAIACAMRGAEARAIEIDDWVARNAVDNVLLNQQAAHVHVECGDASLLGNGQAYDVILANINRNILLADMSAYAADLRRGGLLLMSGFYEADVPAIRSCAESLGLTYLSHTSLNDWVVIKIGKN